MREILFPFKIKIRRKSTFFFLGGSVMLGVLLCYLYYVSTLKETFFFTYYFGLFDFFIVIFLSMPLFFLYLYNIERVYRNEQIIVRFLHVRTMYLSMMKNMLLSMLSFVLFLNLPFITLVGLRFIGGSAGELIYLTQAVWMQVLVFTVLGYFFVYLSFLSYSLVLRIIVILISQFLIYTLEHLTSLCWLKTMASYMTLSTGFNVDLQRADLTIILGQMGLLGTLILVLHLALSQLLRKKAIQYDPI